jgi:hypothetical protein
MVAKFNSLVTFVKGVVIYVPFRRIELLSSLKVLNTTFSYFDRGIKNAEFYAAETQLFSKG